MSACVTRLCFIPAQSRVAPTQSSIERENPKTSGPVDFVGTRLVGLEFPLRTHRRGQGGRRLQGGGPSRGDRVNQRASVSHGASPNGKRDSPAAEILHADRGQYFGDGLADAATGAGAEVKRLLQVRLRDIGTQSLNRRPMRSMTSRIEPRQRLKQPSVSKSKDIGTTEPTAVKPPVRRGKMGSGDFAIEAKTPPIHGRVRANQKTTKRRTSLQLK